MKLTSNVSRGEWQPDACSMEKQTVVRTVVSLSFGVGETSCSQGIVYVACSCKQTKTLKEIFSPPECSINVNAPLLYEISTCTKTRQDDPKRKKKHCHIHTENEMQLDYIKGNKVLSIHPHITINLLIRQMTKFVCIGPNYFLDFILLLQKDHFYILYVELCCWLQINVNTAYCRDNKLYKARYTCMYPCTLNAML